MSTPQSTSQGTFWEAIDAQLEVLRAKGTTADLVCQVLPPIRGVSDTDAAGFFAGSGGEVQVSPILEDLGWVYLWVRASYHWCMQAPDGSLLTYIEGDLYKGDRR